jgi:hypothetical protein
MKIKHKWTAPFLGWPAFGLDIAINQANGWHADRAIRVMHVIGVLVITAVLLMLIQPWKPDEPKPSRG